MDRAQRLCGAAPQKTCRIHEPHLNTSLSDESRDMMNLVLAPLHGGASVPLDKAILFFGRGSECDVVLTDSRKVSRKHCCVAQIDNRVVVRDLGSMNGSRINEQVLKNEGQLVVGDVLWVGDMGFRLEPVPSRSSKGATVVKRVPLPADRKSKSRPDIRYLSQDLPVAIPENQKIPFERADGDQRITHPDESADNSASNSGVRFQAPEV